MINSAEITKAISAHGLWKSRLRQALESGSSEVSVSKVKMDNQCDFGKWLYSLSPEDNKSSDWTNVQQLHAKFHIEASRLLDLALKGKKKEFEDGMALGKEFPLLSSKLTAAMMKWSNYLSK